MFQKHVDNMLRTFISATQRLSFSMSNFFWGAIVSKINCESFHQVKFWEIDFEFGKLKITCVVIDVSSRKFYLIMRYRSRLDARSKFLSLKKISAYPKSILCSRMHMVFQPSSTRRSVRQETHLEQVKQWMEYSNGNF